MSNKSGNDAYWHFCEALADLADRDDLALEFVRDDDADWHCVVVGRLHAGATGLCRVSLPFADWTHIRELPAYRNRLWRAVSQLLRVERERVYGGRVVAGR